MWNGGNFTLGFAAIILILSATTFRQTLARKCRFGDEALVTACAHPLVNVVRQAENFTLDLDELKQLCERYDGFMECSANVTQQCRQRILPGLVSLWEYVCDEDFRKSVIDESACLNKMASSEKMRKCLDSNPINLNDARYATTRLCAATQKRFRCFAGFDELETCEKMIRKYQTFYEFVTQQFRSDDTLAIAKSKDDAKLATNSNDNCTYESVTKMLSKHKQRKAERALIVGCDDDGGSCRCIDGYSYENTTQRCVDVDECAAQTHECGQVCVNRAGGYNCTCDVRFYTLSKADNRTCVGAANSAPIWLVFAHGQSIWNVSDDGKFVELKFAGLEKTAMIDVDYRGNSVYFVDSGRNLIEKISLNKYAHLQQPPSSTNGSDSAAMTAAGAATGSSIAEVLQAYEVDGVEGIAVDYVARNLYAARKADIFVQTLDARPTHFRKRLYKNRLVTPRALVFHAEQGMLYGSDWSSQPFIYRAAADGSYFQKIIITELVWPNGLAVDHYAQRLYWADAFLDLIQSADFDGSRRRTVLARSGAVAHLFGLAVADRYVYWTDWNHRGILRADKMTGRNVTLLAQTTLLPYAVKVFHATAQPYRNATDSAESLAQLSPCRSANCSQICLLSHVGGDGNDTIALTAGAICTCADGYTLAADGRTCHADCREPAANVIVCGGSEPKCVNKRYVCDGILHCPDRLDEQNCPERVCPLGEFQCVDEPTKCVDASAVCDGTRQCRDGSDERYCAVKKMA